MMSDCGNHDTELYCLLTSGFEIYIKIYMFNEMYNLNHLKIYTFGRLRHRGLYTGPFLPALKPSNFFWTQLGMETTVVPKKWNKQALASYNGEV